MKVLIVSRTICSSMRCVGGIAFTDTGLKSVRLLNPAHLWEGVQVDGYLKGFWEISAPFQVGELWELDMVMPARVIAPHCEDMVVRQMGECYGSLSAQELELFLAQHADQVDAGILWHGAPSYLYDGKLKSSRMKGGKGYITSDDAPSCSTGFWIPDMDLVYRPYFESHKGVQKWNYVYADGHSHEALDRLCYVGEPCPVSIIPAGTLLRVSLARWFDSGHYGSVCWLQISGWY